MYKKFKPEIVQPDIIMYSGVVYSNPFNSFLQESIPLEMHILKPFYKLGENEKHPLLVWISGGGFRSSSPARNIPELVEYAKNGYVVASVRYRVSSESCFPTQIQDVKTAIRFLKHHHEQYGIDPEQVVVGGHSAGAYLAGMVAATEGIEMFETEEWTGVSSSVKAAVCMSGGDFFLNKSTVAPNGRKMVAMELFLDNDAQPRPDLAEIAGITQYLSENTPPMLLIHGSNDELISSDVNKMFYEELVKAGVEADFYEIEGAGHGTVELRQPEIQHLIIDFFNHFIGN